MNFEYKNYFHSDYPKDNWGRMFMVKSVFGDYDNELLGISITIHSRHFNSQKYEQKQKQKDQDTNWGKDDCYDISDELIFIPSRCLPFLISVLQKIML